MLNCVPRAECQQTPGSKCPFRPLLIWSHCLITAGGQMMGQGNCDWANKGWHHWHDFWQFPGNGPRVVWQAEALLQGTSSLRTSLDYRDCIAHINSKNGSCHIKRCFFSISLKTVGYLRCGNSLLVTTDVFMSYQHKAVTKRVDLKDSYEAL